MADEFVLTYPCFFPMGKGGYLTVISDDGPCLPLLTDRDVVERFFRDKFPKAETISVSVQTIPNRDTLLATLDAFEAERKAGKHRVAHVAFDPCGQAIVARTTVREFIEYVEQQAE